MKKLFGIIAGLFILFLVAISVVSVLAGMMLPSLQRARQHAESRGSSHDSGFVVPGPTAGQHPGFVGQTVPMREEPAHALLRYGKISSFAGCLIFLVIFGIVVLLVLRRIFSNPEKRKQRELCYDELQQLSQSIAKLDSRLSSLEEIIAS